MTSQTPMLMFTGEPTECQSRLPNQTRSISEVTKQWQTNPFLAQGKSLNDSFNKIMPPLGSFMPGWQLVFVC